jgi:hypothetical protein
VISELNSKALHEMLQDGMKTRAVSLSADDENRIVKHCLRQPSTQCPLFIMLTAAFLAR